MQRRRFVQAVTTASSAAALAAQQTPPAAEPLKIAVVAAEAASEPTAPLFTAPQFDTLKRLGELLQPAANGRPGAMEADAAEFLDFLEAESRGVFTKPFTVLTAEQADKIQSDKVNPPGYSIHELGTCRMGDDPKKSVLNKFNQSHAVRSLFIVDGSAFVTGGWQNPTLTILALSMRASEHLADELKQGNLQP